MKKSVILFLFILLFLHSLIAFSGSGSGTIEDPYIINSASLLDEVRDDLTAHYKQTADIDLSGVSNWVPIAGGGTATKFTGVYDGDGHTISNLTIDRTSTINVGLFGHIGEEGSGDGVVIQKLGLLNVDVKGARGTGSLVGRVTGDENTYIEYCFARNGTVVGDGATGGLVGSNNSYVTTPSNRDHHPTIQYS